MHFGVSLESTREEVREIVGEGKQVPAGYIPFTPRAKMALELSLREALMVNSTDIDTEHLLLGLIKEAERSEGNGMAAQVLAKLSIDLDALRQVIHHISDPNYGAIARDEEGRVVVIRVALLPREVELLAATTDASAEQSLVLARILEGRARKCRKFAANT